MKHALTIAAAFLLLVLSVTPAHANHDTMYAVVSGKVLQQAGPPVAGARVEFVIRTENGKTFNIATRTNENGEYRFERVRFGTGYAKVSSPDGRGATTEFVAIDRHNIVINFML